MIIGRWLDNIFSLIPMIAPSTILMICDYQEQLTIIANLKKEIEKPRKVFCIYLYRQLKEMVALEIGM